MPKYFVSSTSILDATLEMLPDDYSNQEEAEKAALTINRQEWPEDDLPDDTLTVKEQLEKMNLFVDEMVSVTLPIARRLLNEMKRAFSEETDLKMETVTDEQIVFEAIWDCQYTDKLKDEVPELIIWK